MKIQTKYKIKKAIKQSRFEIGIIALVLFALCVTSLPSVVLADSFGAVDPLISLEIKKMTNSVLPFGVLPISEDRGFIYVYNVPVTAYNSVSWQTDSTPCIGAAGTDICEALEQGSNTCAANFVPLGTVLQVDGLGVCVVRDRMNARYDYRVDWYMGLDIDSAKVFGIQNKEISVLVYN